MAEVNAARAASLTSIVIRFVMAVAVVLGLVRLLAVVPLQVEAIHNRLSPEYGFGSRMVNLDSIEEAEQFLETDVWLPIYYPDYLPWPPSTITAQRYPGKSVALVFRGPDQREVLVLRQYLYTNVNRHDIAPEPRVVLERSEVMIGNVEGTLVKGHDGEGNPRNVLCWTFQGRLIAMAGGLPTEDMLKMARSLRSAYRVP